MLCSRHCWTSPVIQTPIFLVLSKRCCEWAPEHFGARNTHDDVALYCRSRISAAFTYCVMSSTIRVGLSSSFQFFLSTFNKLFHIRYCQTLFPIFVITHYDESVPMPTACLVPLLMYHSRMGMAAPSKKGMAIFWTTMQFELHARWNFTITTPIHTNVSMLLLHGCRINGHLGSTSERNGEHSRVVMHDEQTAQTWHQWNYVLL